MKNKGLIIIMILSILVIGILIYSFFFRNTIYFNNFISEERLEVYGKYVDKKIDVCYGNRMICKKIKYDKKGNVDSKKVGVYVVTYSAKHGKKVVTKEKKIKVIDTKPPELVIDGSFNNVCPNGKALGVTYKATDNYDGDITSNIKYSIKNDKIIYKVSDSSGNTTTKEFDVVINDNEKPSIVLNDDSTVYLGVGNQYDEPGYAAVDNCDGDITKNVKVDGNVDVNKEGSYILTYSVSDSFKNETSVKRTVKVFNRNNYTPGVVTEKTIYLTFDDGPGVYTAKLLDILKKYDVKATFFVTGHDSKNADLIKREHDEGHTVGLHSFSHNYAKIYVSEEAYMEDLLAINDRVKSYTGADTKIIRFPGGSSNTVSRRYRNGIMSLLTKKVEEIGFRYFDWDISSGDAGNTKDTNQVYINVTSAIKPDKSNVVLMHDVKSYSVDAVERIIEYGLSNGYTFAPLTMESPVVHQKVNN